MAKEQRTQLFFFDDMSFKFLKRQVEASCLVEKSGDKFLRAWKDFYGTLFVFPGYKAITPAYVSLGYSRDIILDPFNRVPTGEMTTQKPDIKQKESIGKWIAKVAENRRHILRGEKQNNNVYNWSVVVLLVLIIVLGLAIAARFSFGHKGVTAGLLTLLGMTQLRKQPGKPEDKIKNGMVAPTNWRKIFWFGGAAVSLAATAITFILYSKNPTANTFLALPFIVTLGLTIFLVYRGVKSEASVTVIVGETVDKKMVANSVNIYPNKILFEKEEKPLGQPHRCRNDNKHYYIHKMEPVDNGFNMVAFALPDFQYYDPENFGMRVLGQPAHKRLFKRKIKLGQMVSLAILGVMVGIEFIAMIAMNG